MKLHPQQKKIVQSKARFKSKIRFKCSNCSKELEKWSSQIPKSGKGYCSASCSTSYRNRNEYNPSHYRDLSGENNPMFGKGYLVSGENNSMYGKRAQNSPNWKGGKFKRKDGYFRTNVDGVRILEHRKILMDKGFNLEGKIVHHKNRDRSDNSIENLLIMDRVEHINEHRQELIDGRIKTL